MPCPQGLPTQGKHLPLGLLRALLSCSCSGPDKVNVYLSRWQSCPCPGGHNYCHSKEGAALNCLQFQEFVVSVLLEMLRWVHLTQRVLLEHCCWSREPHGAVKGMSISLRNRAHAGNMWHSLENCHLLALNIPAVGLGGSQALCHELAVPGCIFSIQR